VVFPSAAAIAEADAEVAGGYTAQAEVEEPISTAPSCGYDTFNSNDHDFESIVAKKLEKMLPELAAMAKDPRYILNPRTLGGSMGSGHMKGRGIWCNASFVERWFLQKSRGSSNKLQVVMETLRSVQLHLQ
jgi:hypothetical protein